MEYGHQKNAMKTKQFSTLLSLFLKYDDRTKLPGQQIHLKKLPSYWKSIPDQVVAEVLKRGVADAIAYLEKHNDEADEEKKGNQAEG